MALFKAKKFAEAKTAFAAVAANAPENAEAQFYLGWAALRNNQLSEALPPLEKAVQLDAKKSLYFQVLGDAYLTATQQASVFSRMGLAKKCLAAYGKAIELDPDNLEARKARLEYYAHAPAIAGGGMSKAYAEAEEIRKRDLVRGALLLCDLYAGEKKIEEGFAHVEKLAAAEPDNRYLYVLGTFAAKSGRNLDKGAAALLRYLECPVQANQPAPALAHWRLGAVYEKKGDTAKARSEYQAALKLQPGFRPAQEALKNLK